MKNEAYAMDTVTEVAVWLRTAPFWDGQLLVDTTDPVPGSCGLFPMGLETLQIRQDVLGNQTRRYRLSFLLRREAVQRQAAAQWLLQLQMWVAEQSRQGLAPQFGDLPEAERFWAEKGRMTKVSQTGTATYEVRLSAEFTKIYEVI